VSPHHCNAWGYLVCREADAGRRRLSALCFARVEEARRLVVVMDLNPDGRLPFPRKGLPTGLHSQGRLAGMIASAGARLKLGARGD